MGQPIHTTASGPPGTPDEAAWSRPRRQPYSPTVHPYIPASPLCIPALHPSSSASLQPPSTPLRVPTVQPAHLLLFAPTRALPVDLYPRDHIYINVCISTSVSYTSAPPPIPAWNPCVPIPHTLVSLPPPLQPTPHPVCPPAIWISIC